MTVQFEHIENLADEFMRRDREMTRNQAYDLAIKSIQMAALDDISMRLGRIEEVIKQSNK